MTDETELPDLDATVPCDGTIYGTKCHLEGEWHVFGKCDGCETQMGGVFCVKHLTAILGSENEMSCLGCGDPSDLKETLYKMERL